MNFDITSQDYYIMGILNITPDSFYDGGSYTSIDHILLHVDKMIKEGVDIVDIGGESSRPGSQRISIQEEIDRLLPVVEKIREHHDIPISIDSMKPEVIQQLLPYKIQIINDISSLSDDRFIKILKDTGTYICLMHMLKTPETMQDNPNYDNVLNDVTEFLQERFSYCLSQGIDKKNIIIDPGFGFGKTLDHNYTLLKNLRVLTEITENILVGISRKSMIGNLLNKSVNDRLEGSLAATVLSIINCAKIIRTHDVRETKIAALIAQEFIGINK
tara:strand:+ start:90 stop:908 length:819 start_codon:yes stop_codon:yes gene_type:complete